MRKKWDTDCSSPVTSVPTTSVYHHTSNLIISSIAHYTLMSYIICIRAHISTLSFCFSYCLELERYSDSEGEREEQSRSMPYCLSGGSNPL